MWSQCEELLSALADIVGVHFLLVNELSELTVIEVLDETIRA